MEQPDWFAVLYSIVALVASIQTSQFVAYDQFAPLLSSKEQSKQVEYVVTSHPDFEYISYLLSYEVLSVKLSKNKTEQYVFIPRGKWDDIARRLEDLRIHWVIIDR
jgi:hypothetical protein